MAAYIGPRKMENEPILPLLERLSYHVEKTPDKIATTFLLPGPDGGKIARQLTFQQLQTLATDLAEKLLHSGLKEGNRALLVYPPGLDFLIAFLACLKAQIIAVPVFPPNPSRSETLKMFEVISRSCKANVALTNGEYSHMKKLASIKNTLRLKKSSISWPELTWISTDDKIDASCIAHSRIPSQSSSQSDIAFLQFTSGSSSNPKGVMITFHNLSQNLALITSELNASKDTVVVSWLPQYHDMGLIGSLLGVLYCGGSGYYLSPLSFLQRPLLWIEAVSKYRSTHLQAPNFAFKLTARKLIANEYKSKPLDLSSIRHIINAAEPVDTTAMDDFCAAFAPFGLPPNVLFPTYGLAEHTVFVCSNGKTRLTVDRNELETNNKVVAVGTKNPPLTATLCGCGVPPPSVTIQIVNSESKMLCGEDVVGEIWIHSSSKAAGYYLKPKETSEYFHASIANDTSNTEGYLRSGDLGFLHGGELFICGRLKDIIIVGGRNYYPQDLESTAEKASDLIRPGCSAAFTIDPIGEGGERIAMVMELKDVPKSQALVESVCMSLASEIRNAIIQEHSISLFEICFLQTRTVPKTSSGKIARAWCRKGYVNDSLNVVYQRKFTLAEANSSPLEIEASDESRRETKSKPIGSSATPTGDALSSVDLNGLRSLPQNDILAKLISDVARTLSVPESSISKDAALVTMMDSLTISQIKGLLENNYCVRISDEYMFRESTTLEKLAAAVKLGYAPDDQVNESPTSQSPATHSSPGTATGLAGALGCPPGVVCVIL